MLGNYSLFFILGLLVFNPYQNCLSSGYRGKNEKYRSILIWSLPTYNSSFHNHGAKSFKEARCPFKNCYLTTKKSFFNYTSHFEVILFIGANLYKRGNEFYEALQMKRSPAQNYIYMNQESPQNSPLCYKELDGFFNITWTYKLDSDLLYPYFIIRNRFGEVIGPQKDMHWIKQKDMKPIGRKIEKRLMRKNRAVAWLVSKCETKSSRAEYVKNLTFALKKYSLTVDIFGKCGPLRKRIPKYLMPKFWHAIQVNYLYYLAFENSFGEDYVTEKVLMPLKYYTVPIVYGTANYTRFMPDGIYLNAMQISPEELAYKIYESMYVRNKYKMAFRWHNYYSYHHHSEGPRTNVMCRLCDMINDEYYMRKEKVIEDFRDWWNGPGVCYDEDLSPT